MSRLRPLRPILPRVAPTPSDEPIARAVRNLLWARRVDAPDVGRPTSMRATLSFWTSTSSTAAELPRSTASHRLEVLGWERATRRVYLVEHAEDRASLFAMATRGEHAGVAVPVSGDAARIAALAAELAPLVPAPARGWTLKTRVVQRRGLRLASMTTPIRKFALGITVHQHVGGIAIATGKATVTAYLRPRALIDRVWQVPGEALAVAVVGFCGVPAGVGFDKQAAILAAPTLP